MSAQSLVKLAMSSRCQTHASSSPGMHEAVNGADPVMLHTAKMGAEELAGG